MKNALFHRGAARLPALLAALGFAACAHVPSQKDLENAEIHYDLGVNAVSGHREQEAVREFQEAMKLNPLMPEPHNAMGLLYHWSYHRLADAKVEFQKAVELRPEYPEAWNNLGALHADLGELAPARAAFERALADPLYRTPYVAQTNLGWVLHLQGKTATGQQLVVAALAAKPDYCMGHRTLARIYEALGNAVEAEASWEGFAKSCPDEPEALYKLGTVQARRGEQVPAALTFMKCIEKAGPKLIARDCRTALSALPPLSPEDMPPDPKAQDRGQPGAHDLESGVPR